MKVLLLKTVAGLGESGDVVNVKDGYGMNYLLPNGLARTTHDLPEKEARRLSRALKSARIGSNGGKLSLVGLKDGVMTIKVKANAQGGMFSSLTEKKVVNLLVAKNALGSAQRSQKSSKVAPLTGYVKKSKIKLELKGTEFPIKKVGDYNIVVLLENEKLPFTLKVRKIDGR